jgi:hypothetical protein
MTITQVHKVAEGIFVAHHPVGYGLKPQTFKKTSMLSPFLPTEIARFEAVYE